MLPNKPKFKVVYSRHNSPKIKNGVFVINLDEYESIGAHWTVLYVNDGNVYNVYNVDTLIVLVYFNILLYWIYSFFY